MAVSDFPELTESLDISDMPFLLPQAVVIARPRDEPDASSGLNRIYDFDHPVYDGEAGWPLGATIQPSAGSIREQWSQDQGVTTHRMYMFSNPDIRPGYAVRDKDDTTDRWFMVNSPSRRDAELGMLYSCELIEQIEGAP